VSREGVRRAVLDLATSCATGKTAVTFEARLLTRREIEDAFAELNSSGEVSGVRLRFVERDVGVMAVFEPSKRSHAPAATTT
jgi:hypothetical protein